MERRAIHAQAYPATQRNLLFSLCSGCMKKEMKRSGFLSLCLSHSRPLWTHCYQRLLLLRSCPLSEISSWPQVLRLSSVGALCNWFLGYHTKLPQTLGFKTTEMYARILLVARGPKHHSGVSLLRGRQAFLSLASCAFFWLQFLLWPSLLFGVHPDSHTLKTPFSNKVTCMDSWGYSVDRACGILPFNPLSQQDKTAKQSQQGASSALALFFPTLFPHHCLSSTLLQGPDHDWALSVVPQECPQQPAALIHLQL